MDQSSSLPADLTHSDALARSLRSREEQLQELRHKAEAVTHDAARNKKEVMKEIEKLATELDEECIRYLATVEKADEVFATIAREAGEEERTVHDDTRVVNPSL